MADDVNEKACTKCGCTKPLDEFSFAKPGTTRRRGDCKACKAAHSRKRYNDDPLFRQRVSALTAVYYQNHREEHCERVMRNRKKRPAEHAKTQKLYRERARQQIAKRTAKWNADNKARRREIGREWARRNPEKAALYGSKRRTVLLRATATWVVLSELRRFYLEARRLTVETGYQWDVDHIVPLRSPLVCGLHCEANLRVLPKHENIAKSNLYWPDKP